MIQTQVSQESNTIIFDRYSVYYSSNIHIKCDLSYEYDKCATPESAPLAPNQSYRNVDRHLLDIFTYMLSGHELNSSVVAVLSLGWPCQSMTEMLASSSLKSQRLSIDIRSFQESSAKSPAPADSTCKMIIPTSLKLLCIHGISLSSREFFQER